MDKSSFAEHEQDHHLQPVGLQRSLQPRHITLIAIGGVIGTGLFLGTGSLLQAGGPLGLLLGYVIMATLLFSVMVALGEMITELNLPGGQFALSTRFISPEIGFAQGVLFWYK
jgi:amino acid transporter